MPGATLALHSLTEWEGKKIKENVMGQEKGNLEKQRPHAETNENIRLIFYFLSAGRVQPLPQK